MAEYIEREAVKEAIGFVKLHCVAYGGNKSLLDVINEIPAADVAPVVHGHWIYHPDDLFPNDATQECSCCHQEEYLTLYNENYCPNGGAKMDEEVRK